MFPIYRWLLLMSTKIIFIQQDQKMDHHDFQITVTKTLVKRRAPSVRSVGSYTICCNKWLNQSLFSAMQVGWYLFAPKTRDYVQEVREKTALNNSTQINKSDFAEKPAIPMLLVFEYFFPILLLFLQINVVFVLYCSNKFVVIKWWNDVYAVMNRF